MSLESGPAGIYITTVPPGAVVYLGDVKVGITPFQIADLKSGISVRVTLRKDDYHPVSFDVDLRPGRVAKFKDIELKSALRSLEIGVQ